MTVSSTTRTAGPFTGNGSQTEFAFTMRVFTDADIVATETDTNDVVTTLVLGSDYTVEINDDQRDNPGGTLTMLSALTTGHLLNLTTALEATQGSRLTNAGGFYPEVIENALDKLTILHQQSTVSKSQVIRAPFPEEIAELPSAPDRAGKILAFDASGDLSLTAPVSGDATDLALDLASDTIAVKGSGQVGHGNGVSYAADTVGYNLPWVTYRGAGSDTTALQALLTAGYNIQISGTCYAHGLTVATAGQRIRGVGRARIIKDANGPLITFSADDQEADGIEFRGDASSPTYTGDNVVSTGNNFRLINCGSRWASGRAVKATGDAPLIEGCCDIYQTADSSGTGYDIEFGLSGTARLYGRVIGIRTTQSTGGILFTDTGSFSVVGSQVGKITVAAGTSPSGVNGGNFIGNRILGAVTVGIANSVFSGNTLSAVAVSFASGTSGHAFDESNVLSVGATLTDSSNQSNVVDSRLVPFQSYACSWTGATTNPAIGNGTLTSYRSSVGKKTTVSVKMVAGSTTTFGSGVWYFSLPSTPNASLNQVGAAIALDSGTNFRIGAVQTLTDGTARCQVTFDSDNSACSPSLPFTWASGDTLNFSLTYWE